MNSLGLLRPRRGPALAALGFLLCGPWFAQVATAAATATTSINSTSQNKPKKLNAVPQAAQLINGSKGYRVLATNDLGMHCSDLDYRIAAILPPYNSVHSQVVRIGSSSASPPRLLDATAIDLYYSAVANPQEPLLAGGAYTPPPGYENPPAGTTAVFKGNFWACQSGAATCAATATNAYKAYNPFYPVGILGLFKLMPDYGLPTPDVERLYLGDGQLTADQSAMPGQSGPMTANAPQKFGRYNQSYPVFKDFPFGYVAQPGWFSAEGIPITNWDDGGRLNAYPLLRVQAVAKGALPTDAANLLASLDTVAPVSGEANCRSCHTDGAAANGGLGGNGVATVGLAQVFSAADDPKFGKLPLAVSVEYAADKNIVSLHDQREGAKYINSATGKAAPCDAAHPGNCLIKKTPVACQTCHYTPALDLAQVGPLGPGASANGRQQTLHESMSRVMHGFHGALADGHGAKLIPDMPAPGQRTPQQTQALLQQTCYTCHPGNNTKCLRGVMAENNVVCQDCHGGMAQIGEDFSKGVSRSHPGAFTLDGSLRVPWADEPGCGSCHTGDALSNLAKAADTVKSADGINLAQAYRVGDASAKPIVPGNDALGVVGVNGNKRFAEPVAATALGAKPMLYRFSTGHGGVYCQGCHGSTHAEWSNTALNDNDDVPSAQLQGHTGPIVECSTCHKNDLGITLNGPHGMHPVGASRFVQGGHEDYAEHHLNECRACHGTDLKGTALSKAQAERTLKVEDRTVKIAKGQAVACNTCHEMPGH
ncbi:hypothetical protein SAMN02949497_2735 [Methylomagnum ishizawai]|uniref:Uncharacterized protein n=1 Tax=Methylomagnum ishizawai TaxID=1760988 RepID=A0A1Y6D4A8_9GAMM|nr:cytochrome C [Methylomagnum ishizawai]SMF95372.1 hypothetical protein SAMN02949497_2735 [Methylomagnum ishizawai]